MSDNLENKSDKSCCLCGSKTKPLVNLFSENYKAYAQKIQHLLEIEVCNTRSSRYICGLCTFTINAMEDFREKTRKFYNSVTEKIKCSSNNSTTLQPSISRSDTLNGEHCSSNILDDPNMVLYNTKTITNGESSITDKRMEVVASNLKRDNESIKSEHSSKKIKHSLSVESVNNDYLKANTQTHHRSEKFKGDNFNMEHTEIKNKEPTSTKSSPSIIIMMNKSPSSNRVISNLPANYVSVTNNVEPDTSNKKNDSIHGSTSMINSNFENKNLASVANTTADKRTENRDKIANIKNPFPKESESYYSVSNATVSSCIETGGQRNSNEIPTSKASIFDPIHVQKGDKTPRMERVTVPDDKRRSATIHKTMADKRKETSTETKLFQNEYARISDTLKNPKEVDMDRRSLKTVSAMVEKQNVGVSKHHKTEEHMRKETFVETKKVQKQDARTTNTMRNTNEMHKRSLTTASTTKETPDCDGSKHHKSEEHKRKKLSVEIKQEEDTGTTDTTINSKQIDKRQWKITTVLDSSLYICLYCHSIFVAERAMYTHNCHTQKKNVSSQWIETYLEECGLTLHMCLRCNVFLTSEDAKKKHICPSDQFKSST